MADDPRILLEAIRDFRSKVGPEAHRYLNIDAILHDQVVAELLRVSIERSIAREYLPGFHFRDTNHFLWHLKNEQHALRYLIDDTIPPERFINHWIRRFLVPNRYHYLSEVALAIHKRTDSHNRLRKMIPVEERKTVSKVGWMALMSEWLEIRDCDRGYEVAQRNAQTWRSLHQRKAPSKQSLLNWANNASIYRDERRAETPYNGWYIDSIQYHGGQLQHAEAARSAFSMIDTGYLEVWKWHAPSTGDSPRTQHLSFMMPTAPDTWGSPARKYRPALK